MEDGREGCARRMRVQTQGEGVTPTRAVSPEVSFPACGWGVGEQCLKWLLKLVSLQGFVSFHHGDLETRAGGGGRAQWAFSILSWAGMRTTRGAGFQGAGPACPSLSCSCSPRSPPRSGEGRGLRRQGWGQALLSPF